MCLNITHKMDKDIQFIGYLHFAFIVFGVGVGANQQHFLHSHSRERETGKTTYHRVFSHLHFTENGEMN